MPNRIHDKLHCRQEQVHSDPEAYRAPRIMVLIISYLDNEYPHASVLIIYCSWL